MFFPGPQGLLDGPDSQLNRFRTMLMHIYHVRLTPGHIICQNFHAWFKSNKKVSVPTYPRNLEPHFPIFSQPRSATFAAVPDRADRTDIVKLEFL